MDSLEFDLSSTNRKRSPKKGRRAAVSGGTPNFMDQEDMDDFLSAPSSPGSMPDNSPAKISISPTNGPPRNRKAGGWANSAKGGGFGPVPEDRRFMRQNSNSDDEIPMIPDLDEVVEEDFTQQVAQAPNISVNKVFTYGELNTDLFRHAAFSTLDDIDLRLLTKPLVNESDVREPDIGWKWDALFTEVSSELLNEWEPEEDKAEMEGSP